MIAQRLAFYSLATSAALLPLLGLFAPLGIAPLFILASVACLPAAISGRFWRRVPRPLAIALILVFVWAGLSVGWALDSREALGGAAKLAITSLAGLVVCHAGLNLDDRQRRRIGWILLASVLVTNILLAVEYLNDRMISHGLAWLKGKPLVGVKSALNRGATVAVLGGLAASLFLLRHGHGKWYWVLATTIIALLAGDSLSVRLSITFALGAAVLVLLSPRGGLRTIQGVLVLLAVLVPLGAAHIPSPHYTFQHWTWLPMSSHHRLTIWGFTGQHVAEKPILGWGMEASRSMPDADVEIQVWRYAEDGSRTNVGLLETQLPLHPHNAILQVWLELGAIGMAGIAFAWIYTLHLLDRRVATDDRAGRATVIAAFVASLMVSTVSYGYWQSWWQATMWFTAALCLTFLSRSPAPENQE